MLLTYQKESVHPPLAIHQPSSAIQPLASIHQPLLAFMPSNDY